MTDWPDLRPPCADNPDGWDVPASLTSRYEAELAYRAVTAAVRACRVCPALAPCSQWAAVRPPQHVVQAAVVWGADRKPRQVAAWWNAAQEKVSYHRRRRAIA